MALYLRMDGVDDYIKLPSMTLNKIVAEVKVRRKTDTARFIWDFRTGIGFSSLNQTTGGVDTYGSGSVKVNGVTVSGNTVFIPNDTKCTIEHTFSSTGTDDGNIFINNGATASSALSGDIFDIKIYNGTTLVAHYDMTTGTVNDQSGNGRNATLYGGTWLDDGTGGTPTPTVHEGEGVLSSESSLTAEASVIKSAEAILSAVSNLTAEGDKISPEITAEFSASSSLSAVGSVIINGGANLTAQSNLSIEESQDYRKIIDLTMEITRGNDMIFNIERELSFDFQITTGVDLTFNL